MKAQIVSFHCVLRNKLGQVLSTSFNRDVINQLEAEPGGSNRLCGLAAGIQNVQPGEKRQFMVPAEDAYGPYIPSLSMTLKRSELPLRGRSLQIGSEIELTDCQQGRKRKFRVVKLRGDLVELDANHPLAGLDLLFDVEIVSAREACLEDYEDVTSESPGQFLH